MSIFGSGDAMVETIDVVPSLGETRMQDLCFQNIAVQSQPQEVQSQCRDPKTGFLVTKRKGVTEITHTVTITATHYDWQALGLFHDEIPSDVTGNINLNKRITIPTGLTAPYVLTDPDIIAANLASIRVYVTEKGVWGDARALIRTAAPGTAPIDGTEVQIDDATNSLTFDPSLAGASILYKLDDAYAPISSIGVNTVWESFGDVQMWATLFGTGDFAEGIRIHFPRLIRTPAPPTIDFSQSPATITVTFEAYTADGRAFPYRLYNPEFGIAV